MPPKSTKRRRAASSTTTKPQATEPPPAISQTDASDLISTLLATRSDCYTSFTKQISRNDKLEPLDLWRNEFVVVLKTRYEEDSEQFHLSLDELKKLMDWKLQKGKFRPTLPKLIAQNSEDAVSDATRAGFAKLLGYREQKVKDKASYKKCVKDAIQALCVLRGVGPATASLMLSLLSEITYIAPPFFSDECAEFVFEKLRDGDVPKLKYSIAEYMEFVGWWYDLVGPEFKYSMTLLEQGAWCLRLKEQGFTVVKDQEDEEQPATKKPKTK